MAAATRRKASTTRGNADVRLFKNFFAVISLFGLFYFLNQKRSIPSLADFVPEVELEDSSSRTAEVVKPRFLPVPRGENNKPLNAGNLEERQLERGSTKTKDAPKISISANDDALKNTPANKDDKSKSKIKEEPDTPVTTTSDAKVDEEPEVQAPPKDDDKTKNPLNVIIFYPDDWGARDLQDVNPLLKTPTFSQLAKEGMRFTHNAVTTSICWISRATLFSGQYVSGHKSSYLYRPLFATNTEQWTQTWPYLLQKAGYYVGHIGKWQYNDGDYLQKLFNFSSFFEGWILGKDKDGNQTSIVEMAKKSTLRFLRNRPKDKPFAATVAFYPPKGVHEMKLVLPQYAKLYEGIVHPEAYDRAMAWQRLPYFLRLNRTEARARYRYRFETNGTFQETMTAQYATLTHLDTTVGILVEELKAQGVYDDTLIIVTADNGEFHGAHALADKWYPYSESIHVPLIIKDPRMPEKKRGTLDHSFTLNIDLAETVLGAAGLDAPKVMDGRDISDLYLDNPKSTEPWREEFYYEFPEVADRIPASTALVRKDWKYIDWWQYGYDELFDMQNDPFELNDLSNETKYSSIKGEMKERLSVLKHDVLHPRVPGTRCDPLWPAGTKRKEKPNCSPVFPEKCCPADWVNDGTP